LIVCRKPSDKEIAILNNYYSKELKQMSNKKAQKLLAVGEYQIPNQLDKQLIAALMRVVSTIYNLEETITKT